MATKYYGINDKWTDDDIENVIEIASEDGTVDSVKVNGEEYGGGGGGGITGIYELKITGTVTGGEGYLIHFSSPSTIDGSVEYLGAAISSQEYEGMTINGITFTSGSATTKSFYIPTEYSYPLMIYPVRDPDNYTVSGGAVIKEYADDPGVYYLEVTGDFSITGPGEN